MSGLRQPRVIFYLACLARRRKPTTVRFTGRLRTLVNTVGVFMCLKLADALLCRKACVLQGFLEDDRKSW